MASARKQFNPKRRAPGPEHLYAAFIGDVLDGTIVATQLVEQRDGRGRLTRLDYDDPNGNGQGQGQRRIVAGADESSAVSFSAPPKTRAPRKAPAKKPKGGA